MRNTFSLPATLVRWAWCGLLLLSARPGQAQGAQLSAFRTRIIDSLWAELRRPTLPDTMRVLTLFSLTEEYRGNDNPAALRVGRQGLGRAQKMGFVRGELMLLNALAQTAANAEDLLQAERWVQQLQRRTAQAPTTLRRFVIPALQVHALIAFKQQLLPRAISYLRQAERQLPLVANRPGSDYPLNVYYGLGTMYATQLSELPRADSLRQLARYYAHRCAHEARRLHRPYTLGTAYQILASVGATTGRDSAVYYLGQALQIFTRLDQPDRVAETFNNWSALDLRQRRYPAAAAHARQALAAARRVNDTDMEVDARDQLAEALAATSQPAEAFHQAKRARQLHDSLTQVNNQSELQQLQVRFDTQRKESQIKALTQQRATQQARAAQQQQRLWLLGGGLTLVALGAAALSVLALRLRRNRAQLAAQNEELAQTRASQDRLYALVAHDLRSPVVAFSGLADLVHRYVERQDMTRLASLSGQIRQTAQNLSELLDNLLNWAISQRGELTPQPRPLRVADLLAEIADLYQHAATAADVVLKIEAPADLLVQADLNMTRTILRNLTGNALKATPTGGEVCLRAHAQPHGISLEVSDTGAGLNASALAQLQAGPALRVAERGRGAGLGLLLSRSFAEAQGGSLVVSSRPDSAATGTTACLVLPAAQAA